MSKRGTPRRQFAGTRKATRYSLQAFEITVAEVVLWVTITA